MSRFRDIMFYVCWVIGIISTIIFIISARCHCWGMPYDFTLLQHITKLDWVLFAIGVSCMFLSEYVLNKEKK